VTDHYFDADPSAASDRRTVALVLPDWNVELLTDRAVFSGERIDPGTKLLLLETAIADPPPIHALDIGCGYGPIALTLAHRSPTTTVWAIDVNGRAVDLCRDNAAALGLTNVTAAQVGPDDPAGAVPDDVRFDLIWSNPPIRIGKAELHELLRRWLSRLTPTGLAVLVVHKHLGADSLQRWLVGQGFPTERAVSRAGYRLLHVRPAGTDPPRQEPGR
jgi:16S rRNA (guanine1207-N2)-methyltransferase